MAEMMDEGNNIFTSCQYRHDVEWWMVFGSDARIILFSFVRTLFNRWRGL